MLELVYGTGFVAGILFSWIANDVITLIRAHKGKQ